ncbi:MAG: 2'-deoxycytidine 5'-triphosphate deaminase [Planctomycetes bacterium]|nr:2'-deoxycytidine 5'-triphosphate deaminase [Planctomycetota bacterium]
MPGQSLFPNASPHADVLARFPREHGVLPEQAMREFVRKGFIEADDPIEEAQFQPSSLDLRLGGTAHLVPASFLPRPGQAFTERLNALSQEQIDLTRPGGAVLQVDSVYIVELQERLHLGDGIRAIATPKSSTGRLDIFTRLICERATEFERVAPDYEGRLFIEIRPRSFAIRARTGDRLNQLRFRRGPEARIRLTDAQLAWEHRHSGLVGKCLVAEDLLFDQGLRFSVDLTGNESGAPVVYRARKHAREVIDLARIGAYDPGEFWEAVSCRRAEGLILHPDEFYILATVEPVRVPPHLSAEMVAYDTNIGEFRVHYAGFFDPGFGWDASDRRAGTPAVLEVRAHETPFLLEHGQQVGRLVYEYLLATPDRMYGQGIGSNYANQGLTLAKQFRRS